MHARRLAPLRAAALLAVGFVVLRIAYRVAFGGTSGSGIVLLDLPRIPLAGPFSHITLLGPVTTGGIAAAAWSAVPFAVVILAFGVLASLVDIHALLARGSVVGPLRNLSRALVIAWATFPALRDSVRRVSVARHLRGERSAASLIIPVLEHTVERALALGASMEVRGFAAAGTNTPIDPRCERPVEMRDVSLGFDRAWTLRGINLTLAPATLTLVAGPTGSGKSTLLHAMSGLVQHYLDGDQLGEIEVGGADRLATPPRDTARFVGVVSQSVRLSFVAQTVVDELGFSLAVRGVAPVIVRARAIEVAHRLGIEALLGREVGELSAGEACLVAIGAAIIAHPVLLIVDEPLADLDTAARERVIGVLDRLAHEAGVCVVVAEHNLQEWDDVADSRLELVDGTVRRAIAAATQPTAAIRPPAAIGELNDTAAPRLIARIQGLSVRYGDRAAVTDGNFDLAAGDVVALVGPNGAGKSSLLLEVARPGVAGTVMVAELDVSTLDKRNRRRAVALVPEAFDDLLFAATVGDECRRSGSGTVELFAQLLGDDTAALVDRHPRDLSAGQRLCLVMAIQLGARPHVLLVDEPTRGLDSAARELVGSALLRAAASGTAVMVATHDRSFAARFSSRTVSMVAGRINAGVSA